MAAAVRVLLTSRPRTFVSLANPSYYVGICLRDFSFPLAPTSHHQNEFTFNNQVPLGTPW